MTRRTILSTLLLIPTVVLFGFMPQSNGYKVGDMAMSFSLKNIDGKMVSPANYPNAKGFIVVFTCNHCPFAKAYESRIMALDQKYAAKGFPVIAISSNDVSVVPEDSYDNMVKLASLKKYSFPYCYDETQEVVKAYGATVTPHVFVLSHEGGGLMVKYIGAIDDNAQDASAATKHYVEDAVNSLLNGKPIAVTSTKAIGCGMKMKKG